jgi:hypothetical protein
LIKGLDLSLDQGLDLEWRLAKTAAKFKG